MNDTTIVFDPLWMSVTRALKIVGERLSGYGPDGIDTVLRVALRGGDIRAVLLNEPWGEIRLTFEIDRVDWVCVETLRPTHGDVLASAGRAGHDYFFVRLKGWKPNEPPRCGHSTAILGNQIIYGLHHGLVEVNRDDLVAWLTKVAPTPGTVLQHADTKATSPELECWHDKWMREHPDGTQAEELEDMREQFGDQATKHKVADLRRSPDGKPGKRGPKVGKKYAGHARLN